MSLEMNKCCEKRNSVLHAVYLRGSANFRADIESKRPLASGHIIQEDFSENYFNMFSEGGSLCERMERPAAGFCELVPPTGDILERCLLHLLEGTPGISFLCIR